MTKTEPKYPPKDTLRALRLQRGLSMDQLASKISKAKPLIYKLEKGHQRYTSELVNALAKALDVNPVELLKDEMEVETAGPFEVDDKDEVSLYAPRDGLWLWEPHEDPVNPPPPEQAGLVGMRPYPWHEHYVYEVETEALDEIDIIPGDIIVFEFRPEHIERIADGDVLLVKLLDANDDNKGRLILRQFLWPALLVPNSSKLNLPILNMKKTKSRVMGVMLRLCRWNAERPTVLSIRLAQIREPNKVSIMVTDTLDLGN